ncbi:OsmC family protein [Thalassoglobus sp. JC818]|uniref:OsmC family protein n=1 Tax=Thalassoglobus sp. JC818 TaxID=3232136 RepID=UPI0034587F33
MSPDELRQLQAPWKEKFRLSSDAAQATLSAKGVVDVEHVACRIHESEPHTRTAGLHPMAGGDGTAACAAEMLLEALVGCAGVTFAAVSTAMGLTIEDAQLFVEGDVDFRGTLGIDRSVPVGFTDVRIQFVIKSDAPDETLAKAVELAERYCVVAQTLKSVQSSWKRS